MSDDTSAEPGSQNPTLRELRRMGQRLQQLGEILQDPTQVERLYFAPAPHMENPAVSGEPIVLDSADYLPILAVENLQLMLERLRRARRGGGL